MAVVVYEPAYLLPAFEADYVQGGVPEIRVMFPDGPHGPLTVFAIRVYKEEENRFIPCQVLFGKWVFARSRKTKIRAGLSGCLVLSPGVEEEGEEEALEIFQFGH